jgi:hypothetical protein
MTDPYTPSIPGRYTFGESPVEKRKRLMQLRRHLIGTLISVEKDLGMESSIREKIS